MRSTYYCVNCRDDKSGINSPVHYGSDANLASLEGQIRAGLRLQVRTAIDKVFKYAKTKNLSPDAIQALLEYELNH